MAYSNVTPPTLPSYDSVANPYYLIQFEYAIGAENWETVRFWIGAAPLTWNGSAVTNAVAFSLYTYGTGSTEWTAWGVMAEAGEMALTPGPTTADTYMRFYTNHDILDGTGAVWLAKGTVTPTEEDKEAEIQIRKKSQLAGIIAAWCAPVRQFPHREPVAFLYGHVAKEGETPTHSINGVDYVGWIGPKLPVVEGFEFEVLTRHVVDGTERYQLSVFAAPFYAQTFSDGITYVRSNPSAKYQKWVCNAPDFSEWKLESEGNWWAISYEDVCWTNHNIYFGDLVNGEIVYSDELFMTESPAPVPVYE